jgi:hypothetical protein
MTSFKYITRAEFAEGMPDAIKPKGFHQYIGETLSMRTYLDNPLEELEGDHVRPVEFDVSIMAAGKRLNLISPFVVRFEYPDNLAEQTGYKIKGLSGLLSGNKPSLRPDEDGVHYINVAKSQLEIQSQGFAPRNIDNYVKLMPKAYLLDAKAATAS